MNIIFCLLIQVYGFLQVETTFTKPESKNFCCESDKIACVVYYEKVISVSSRFSGDLIAFRTWGNTIAISVWGGIEWRMFLRNFEVMVAECTCLTDPPPKVPRLVQK